VNIGLRRAGFFWARRFSVCAWSSSQTEAMQAVGGGGMMPVVLADHLTSQVEGICGVLAIYCNDFDEVGSLCEGKPDWGKKIHWDGQ
jgi:hypothetical protein